LPFKALVDGKTLSTHI